MADHEDALASAHELEHSEAAWIRNLAAAYLEDHAEVERLREALGRAERERDDARSEAPIPLLAALDDRDAAIQRADAVERMLETVATLLDALGTDDETAAVIREAFRMAGERDEAVTRAETAERWLALTREALLRIAELVDKATEGSETTPRIDAFMDWVAAVHSGNREDIDAARAHWAAVLTKGENDDE